MTVRTDVPLEDPVLQEIGVPHGFGQRASQPPATTRFPEQVHGVSVWEVDEASGERAAATGRPQADVVSTSQPGMTLGIVTADCVPLLASWRDGERVAAIHAGWRGLAAGVIEAGLGALARDDGLADCRVAIGPTARACCYEIDAPVRDGLQARYASLLDGPLRPGRRPGRYQLDLAELASRVVQSYGIPAGAIGRAWACCTICDAERFESYRRDGAKAGRLRHFITRPVTNSASA